MMNFSDLINALERLAFQIISWIILIPKTIFWILATPISVVDYINKELSKKNPSFNSFISPIFLFLFVGIGPIVLEPMIKLPQLNISGEPLVVKDSTYTYTAKIDQLSNWTDFRTEHYVYEYVWSYSKDDSVYVLNTFLFDNYIPEENKIDIVFYETDTIELHLDLYAYQLGNVVEDGATPNVEYSNNNILDKAYAYVDIDTMPFKKQFTVTVFDSIPDLKAAEKFYTNTEENTTSTTTQLTEKKLYTLGLTLLLLPLFFAVSLIVKNGQKIRLPILKRHLYVQCALFSPVILIINFIILLESVLPIAITDNFILILLALALISIIWFIVVESKVYDLTKKEIISILFGIPVIVVLLLMFFIEALIEFSNFKWLIWLFILVILTPIVWGLFIGKKDFTEEEEDQEEVPS